MVKVKQVLNFGLLLSFLTLVVTGVLAYTIPFSLIVTRLHIVFSVFTILFFLYHLSQKYGYFFKVISKAKKVTMQLLFLLCAIWLLVVIGSVNNITPSNYFIDLSYEGRHQREVLRMSPLSATEISHGVLRNVRLAAESEGTSFDDNPSDKKVALTLEIRIPEVLSVKPAIAIWAESTSGSLIETLYLSPELAYTDQPTWHGYDTERVNILPVWRNKFTLASGLAPNGKIDSTTGATNSHSFSLENYFYTDGGEYIIYMEINAPFDSNADWEEPVLGQPSLLYSAYVEHDQDIKHALLELTGHGGGGEVSGAIQYDLSSISTATELLNLGLVSSYRVSEIRKQ